jgi:hypothetical protein
MGLVVGVIFFWVWWFFFRDFMMGVWDQILMNLSFYLMHFLFDIFDYCFLFD